jgi:hypothetical protein
VGGDCVGGRDSVVIYWGRIGGGGKHREGVDEKG